MFRLLISTIVIFTLNAKIYAASESAACKHHQKKENVEDCHSHKTSSSSETISKQKSGLEGPDCDCNCHNASEKINLVKAFYKLPFNREISFLSKPFLLPKYLSILYRPPIS